jgi:hypothetical protein
MEEKSETGTRSPVVGTPDVLATNVTDGFCTNRLD